MLGFNGGLLGKKRKQDSTTPGLWFPNERAVIQGSDPYWDQVSLYLPMTGSNGSTTFSDLSANARTITTVGNAQISTAQWPFAGSGSSGLFDGTGDYLTLSTFTGLDYGTGDFTIECFIYVSSNSVYTGVVDARNSAALQDYLLGVYNVSSVNRLDFVFSGTRITGTSTSVSLTTWTHIAVERYAGTLYLYAAGTKDSATLAATGNVTTLASTPRIASSVDGYDLNGLMSHLRITKAARYRGANFTPPTAPFPVG